MIGGRLLLAAETITIRVLAVIAMTCLPIAAGAIAAEMWIGPMEPAPPLRALAGPLRLDLLRGDLWLPLSPVRPSAARTAARGGSSRANTPSPAPLPMPPRAADEAP
jgi:hypothetical protein